jgi:23S rRNA pseudouridine2605 synthase
MSNQKKPPRRGEPPTSRHYRINRFLAASGLGSRREVEQLIRDGKIYINQIPVTELSQKVDTEKDHVTLVFGTRQQVIKIKSGKKVFLLYKPKGFITTKRDPQNQAPTVYELLPEQYSKLKAVGRLDIQTSGLLLFAEDGDLIYRLTHPSYQLERIYHVQLDREVNRDKIEELEKSIEIHGKPTLAPQISILDPKKNKVKICLKEGRNREVRRIFEGKGFRVLSLHRTKFGPIHLKGLAKGEGRALLPRETDMLYKAVFE